MAMQSTRSTWTDERLDDLAGRVDRGFAELRTDMDKGFGGVDRGFGRVDADVKDLRQTIHRFGGGIILAIMVSELLS